MATPSHRGGFTELCPQVPGSKHILVEIISCEHDHVSSNKVNIILNLKPSKHVDMLGYFDWKKNHMELYSKLEHPFNGLVSKFKILNSPFKRGVKNFPHHGSQVNRGTRSHFRDPKKTNLQSATTTYRILKGGVSKGRG